MTRALIVCALLLCTATVAANPDAAYRQGMDAFNDGDYRAALTAFEQARDAGMDTAQLQFNLGVTHYRLDQLEAADEAFARAAENPDLAGLALYNRGRVATRDNCLGDAEAYYQAALEAAQTDRIRDLAQAALSATREAEPSASPRPRPTLLAELGLGFDNNTALQGDDRPDNGSRDDAFAELLLYGEHQLLGTRERGLRLHGLLNGVRHPDNRTDNFDQIETGVSAFRQLDAWRQEVGASVSRARLDGEHLETALIAHGTLERSLTGDVLGSLRYRAAWFTSGDRFEGLDGMRHDLRARLRGRQGRASWRLDYLFEWNDRDDIQDGDGVISYSPVRHGLSVRWGQPVTNSVHASVHGGLRHSIYPDREDTADGLERREDVRVRLGGQLRHELTSEFTLLTRLDWTDNRSSIDTYQFDRIRGGVAIEYLFQ